MEKILVYDEKKKKKVLAGVIIGATFYKKVTKRHYMICRQGFGISEEVFSIIKKKGVSHIACVYGKETRTVPLAVWEMKSSESFGHGRQKFFPWKNMTVIDSPQMTIFD